MHWPRTTFAMKNVIRSIDDLIEILKCHCHINRSGELERTWSINPPSPRWSFVVVVIVVAELFQEMLRRNPILWTSTVHVREVFLFRFSNYSVADFEWCRRPKRTTNSWIITAFLLRQLVLPHTLVNQNIKEKKKRGKKLIGGQSTTRLVKLNSQYLFHATKTLKQLNFFFS